MPALSEANVPALSEANVPALSPSFLRVNSANVPALSEANVFLLAHNSSETSQFSPPPIPQTLRLTLRTLAQPARAGKNAQGFGSGQALGGTGGCRP